jgi:hypothetical protein
MEKKYIEEKLDEIASGVYGKAMIAYLQEQVREIDSVRGVKTLSEVLGREIACKKMEKIINRLTPSQGENNTHLEYE